MSRAKHSNNGHSSLGIETTDRPFFGYAQPDAPPFGFGRSPSESCDVSRVALHEGAAHLMTIGQTGGGKTNLMIANLLQYRGGVIAIDVRADAARATARFRREVLGQETIILDPFGITGLPTQQLDPLAIACLPGVDVESEAQSLGALLTSEHRSDRDPYWHAQASSLIASALAFLLCQPE